MQLDPETIAKNNLLATRFNEAASRLQHHGIRTACNIVRKENGHMDFQFVLHPEFMVALHELVANALDYEEEDRNSGFTEEEDS